MTFVHRHLDLPPDTDVERLPIAALDDLLERGDLDDWAPLFDAVRRDPHGALADRLLKLTRDHPMYGTSALWRAFIEQHRSRGRSEVGVERAPLREIRARRKKTQAEVARALGMQQSDVSKVERRGGMRVKTLLRYVNALGGEVRVQAVFPDGETIDVELRD